MNCKDCTHIHRVPDHRTGYQCDRNHRLNDDLLIPILCRELKDFEYKWKVL